MEKEKNWFEIFKSSVWNREIHKGKKTKKKQFLIKGVEFHKIWISLNYMSSHNFLFSNAAFIFYLHSYNLYVCVSFLSLFFYLFFQSPSNIFYFFLLSQVFNGKIFSKNLFQMLIYFL